MKLYNSLTRQKEEFTPKDPEHVGMYTCGPTVYHFAHIGNLRSYIMEDILDRYIRYLGYGLKRVMNITDVGHLSSDGDTGEDKMLKGAKREHKSVMDIASFYTKAFFEDCAKLNIRKPDVIEPATACIGDFIKAIKILEQKGYAYQAGGNIYFDTSKLEKYYVFNDFSQEDLAIGVREGVEADANKKNPADFVLWFTKSKFEDQELKWNSPWGLGYPGWHIECSCISMKHLKDHLDIHCGGIDNAFPHHTNEIAQSEALIGHKWCDLWFHVHHLNTGGGKMSKSSGEFLTVSLLEEKGFDPLAYRFFCLQSHYRKSLLFTWENLENAANAYSKLVTKVASLLEQQPNAEKMNVLSDKAAKDPAFIACRAAFTDALDNDLNTSLAVTALYDVFKSDASPEIKLALSCDFDRVLALDLVPHAQKLLLDKAAEHVDKQWVEELIQKRNDAKAEKNYAAADAIRAELLKNNIVLQDTPNGTKWSVKA